MNNIKNSSKQLIINPFDDMESVERIYTSLIKSTSPSFFNSWLWVSTWLYTLPKSMPLKFIVHSVDGKDICCYFLGTRIFSKFKVFNKEKVYLNSTGDMKYDDLVIEYNGVIAIPEYQNMAIELIKESVDVDDIVLPITTLSIQSDSDYFCKQDEHFSYWINLSMIRKENKPYLSYISKNKRNQINRSIKEYGNVKLENAKTTKEALHMLEGLIPLHQKEWVSRGEPGSFSNDYFCSFHHKLITDGFELGNIQLVKVSNDDHVLGYLYNFIYNNEILFYQCGFNYKEGNNFRPGLVSHFKAIEYNLNIGMNKYNFLVGETQYKKSLSTNNDVLHSFTITKKTIKAKIERKIKGVLNRE